MVRIEIVCGVAVSLLSKVVPSGKPDRRDLSGSHELDFKHPFPKRSSKCVDSFSWKYVTETCPFQTDVLVIFFLCGAAWVLGLSLGGRPSVNIKRRVATPWHVL